MTDEYVICSVTTAGWEHVTAAWLFQYSRWSRHFCFSSNRSGFSHRE